MNMPVAARQQQWFDSFDVADLRRRRGAKWQKFGPEALGAWVADMDFPPAPSVAATLAEMLATGDLGYPNAGEPHIAGPAFADWSARRYGWPVDPERVVPTVDVLQPIAIAIEQWTQPGDGVIIQTPIYPPFLTALELSGRRLVDHPLGPASDGYPLDVGALATLVDDTTRMILLCNPHNPTGRVFTRAELIALAELAIEHDLIVVSDEIHADLVYPGATHIPFASLGDEVAARTITVTSSTKTFNIAGLRFALAVFGSAALQERYQSRSRFLSSGPSAPGLLASIAAWRDDAGWVDALVEYLDGNRRIVEAFVAEHLPGVTHRTPQATYLAWLDARELIRSGRCANPAELFLEHGVALNDGATFGVHGEGFVRLNFATSRRVLDRILERLAAAVNAPR